MKFEIIGNRPHIRSDEEMAMIDKKTADEVFKKYKKDIIDLYMKSQGFLKYKDSAYVRKSEIDLLEYLDFQRERYGSKTFCVNIAVSPLYIPHDYISFGFSDRLGCLICGKDIWWDYADESICEKSMQNVKNAIELFAISWFEEMANEEYIWERLSKQKALSRISKCNLEWLNKIACKENRATIICENIEKLKLPKKLI